MLSIPIKREELLREYPLVEEWFNIISDNFNKDMNSDELEFYYSYVFFIPKIDQSNEYYDSIFEEVSKLKYDERLIFELSKVKVDLTIKLGNFQLTESLREGFVPNVINEIITEITKIKMFVEYEFYHDEDVKNSIPELNEELVSYEIMSNVITEELPVDLTELSLDGILDKIANQGIKSLSDDEKDFLDKKSKDI